MVLQRVVDEARILAEFQNGAIGVLNEDGKYIDQFIVSAAAARFTRTTPSPTWSTGGIY